MKFLVKRIIGYIVWKNKTGGRAKTTGWIGLHEYIVVFGKNKSSIKDISIPYSEKTASMYKGKDDNYETRGPFATWPLDTTSMAERKNLRYPITHKGKKIWPAKQWLWEKKRAYQAQKDGLLVFNKQKDGTYKVRFKGYLKDENGVIKEDAVVIIRRALYSRGSRI